MKQSGGVTNGFPDQVSLESLEGTPFYDPDMLEENLIFGSPDRVIAQTEEIRSARR